MAYTSKMQIKTGLCAREGYVGKPLILNGVWHVLFKKTRTITKQYTIVGISTYADAKATADAKTAQYTRTLRGPYISDNGTNLSIDYRNMQFCVAECVPVHTAGCLWQVDINVNEIEERWALDNPSFSSFPQIIPSEYDEPTAQSRVVSAQAGTFDTSVESGASSVTPTISSATTQEVEG